MVVNLVLNRDCNERCWPVEPFGLNRMAGPARSPLCCFFPVHEYLCLPRVNEPFVVKSER